MFPLKNRKTCGYSYGQKTSYTSHHLGQDYTAATGTPLYAPFDGKIVKTMVGEQGGKTIWFKPENDNVIMRFMHLSQIGCNQGDLVFENKVIGLTGNTGSATTGAHLHLDISKNKVIIEDWTNFVDPEKYEWITQEIDAGETEVQETTLDTTTTPNTPPVSNSDVIEQVAEVIAKDAEKTKTEIWQDAICEIFALIKRLINLLK
jgi:hypothetical protein